MSIILYTLFILACFILIVSVLLQPGKSGAGDLFTSSVSSTAFGPRGTQTVLAKITVVAAAFFLLGALMLGIGLGGSRSVMEGAGPQPAASPAPQTTPQADASQPAASPQAEGAGATTTPADSASPATATTPATASSPAASPQAQASPAR
ncbi:MAG TPA: preprotein translocase subunit SecG [Pyrinomonadaceae bacterium]|nr:preprotein translocase subunit SecG [Pyrinomonadaceae bacterium]